MGLHGRSLTPSSHSPYPLAVARRSFFTALQEDGAPDIVGGRQTPGHCISGFGYDDSGRLLSLRRRLIEAPGIFLWWTGAAIRRQSLVLTYNNTATPSPEPSGHRSYIQSCRHGPLRVDAQVQAVEKAPGYASIPRLVRLPALADLALVAVRVLRATAAAL